MIDAIQIKIETLRTVFNVQIVRLTIPSIPATTLSDLISMDVGVSDGELVGVRIACASTDFDLHILAKQDAVIDTVDEIYRSVGISKRLSEMNLGIIFSNDDEFVFDSFGDSEEQSLLYALIDNKDSIATGEITIELALQRQ